MADKKKDNVLKTWRAIVHQKVPILSPVLYAGTFIEDDEPPAPGFPATFCVDPSRLLFKYSPKYAAGFTPEQNAFHLAHESAHYLLEHLDRRFKMMKREGWVDGHNPGSFELDLWMIAEDLAVNWLVEQLTGWKPIYQEVSVNKEWRGLTTEELYKNLKNIRKQMPKPKCSCMTGQPSGADSKSDSANELLKAQIQEAASQGLQKLVDEGKLQPGDMPGELRELALRFAALKRPPNWKDLLRRYLTETSTDCKYMDPSTLYRRRIDLDGLCLPNLSSHPTAKKFVVSIDNSGSVSDKMFSRLCGVIDSVASTLGFQEVVVQHFTTRVMYTERVTHLKGIQKIKRRADGGTALEDCDRKARDHKGQFHVILTDGYVEWLRDYCLPTIIVRTVKSTTEPPSVHNLIGSLVADANEDFE